MKEVKIKKRISWLKSEDEEEKESKKFEVKVEFYNQSEEDVF